MERGLSVLSVTLLVTCVGASLFALGRFAASDDLRGLLFCAVAVLAGLSAQKMLGSGGGDD